MAPFEADLPPATAKSRLEPFKEFILRLKRDGRSYNEIRQILASTIEALSGRSETVAVVSVRQSADARTHAPSHASLRFLLASSGVLAWAVHCARPGSRKPDPVVMVSRCADVDAVGHSDGAR